MSLPTAGPAFITSLLFCAASTAQAQIPQVDWAKQKTEILTHYRSLIQIDTRNPPGNETKAVEYLKKALEAEGIPTKTFALDPARANLVARIKGNGKKRPLLLMGHTDVRSTQVYAHLMPSALNGATAVIRLPADEWQPTVIDGDGEQTGPRVRPALHVVEEAPA